MKHNLRTTRIISTKNKCEERFEVKIKNKATIKQINRNENNNNNHNNKYHTRGSDSKKN